MERLQKVLAARGVASRRKAEELILAGRVQVNGKTVKELGVRVASTDKITVDGEVIGKQPLTYLILNKPPGYVTTASDPQGRPTVLDLVPDTVRLFPVGRLTTTPQASCSLQTTGNWQISSPIPALK